ncbi:hypothetical protein, partial [Vibrio sp. OPT46]|uniref:hypothetical protein n=1 Tax=Vibrio sp. OPT46 TaxID=2778645 RepID=UPI001D150CB9
FFPNDSFKFVNQLLLFHIRISSYCTSLTSPFSDGNGRLSHYKQSFSRRLCQAGEQHLTNRQQTK